MFLLNSQASTFLHYLQSARISLPYSQSSRIFAFFAVIKICLHYSQPSRIVLHFRNHQRLRAARPSRVGGKDIVRLVHFGVFSTSHFAPTVISSGGGERWPGRGGSQSQTDCGRGGGAGISKNMTHEIFFCIICVHQCFFCIACNHRDFCNSWNDQDYIHTRYKIEIFGLAAIIKIFWQNFLLILFY